MFPLANFIFRGFINSIRKVFSMDIIKIGEPIITRTGTVITKYIENVRFFKSIDFTNSTNRCAKQKGLVKTVVRYGEKNKPETLYDTFERQINRGVSEPVENTTSQTPTKKKATPKRAVPSKTTEQKKSTNPQTQPIENPVKPTETTESQKTVEQKKIVGTSPKAVKKTPTDSVEPKGKTNPASKAETVSSGSSTVQRIVPLSPDSLKTEAAKKLYSKIHQYTRLVGDNGTIDKEFRILREEGSNPDSSYALNRDADIYMSLKRADKNLHISLTRKTLDKKKSFVFMEAVIDKDGQMIEGRHPNTGLSFERRGANIRRMKKYGTQYLPVAGNDREWDSFGNRITSSCGDTRTSIAEDDFVTGSFELFIEMARLYTSVLK